MILVGEQLSVKVKNSITDNFLLDRIYENPLEPDSDGHILYDSFRWDWAELPDDEIIDSIEVISAKICDHDFKSYS